MFEKIIVSTVSVFLVIGVGYVVRRIKIIDDDTETSLMRLVLNVLYPCFIISKVPGNENLQSPFVVSTTIAIGASLIFTAYLVCWLVGRVLKTNPAGGLNTFVVAVGVQNYGFIPIPLIESLFPEAQASEIIGVLLVHSLGVEIALWTAGVVIISGSATQAWKRLLNGPTIAIAIGLFLNFTGLYTVIPEFVNYPIKLLAPCAIPIGLILAGATMCGVLEREKWAFDWRVMSTAAVLRFTVLPSLFLLVAFGLSFAPSLQSLHVLLVVQAAMPTAVTPIIIAKHFGGHPRVAVQVCLTTSVLSFVLTPTLLTFALWLLGISVGVD